MSSSKILDIELAFPDEWAGQQPEPRETVDAEDSAQHAVRVGDLGLLLPPTEVSELVEKASICRIPNTASWFSGILSLRGNMVPAFDLHEMFGLAERSPRDRLIVVGGGEFAVAFWIDEMPRKVSFSTREVVGGEPPVPQVIRDHLRACYQKDGRVWIDWDIESFFHDAGKRL